MSPAILGFSMVTVFMILVMTRRMAAVPALIFVPLIFSILAGHGPDTGRMMMEGVTQVSTTAVMLIFAILYFGTMIDAGLFQPLVNRIVTWVGNDPVRATVGHATLASAVGLDGDGTTTSLVSVSSMLPVYKRLGIDVMVFAVVGSLTFIIMNLSPWGGPAARVAASLHIDPSALFVPMLPVAATGLAFVFLLAWWFGRRERTRIGHVGPATTASLDDQIDAARIAEIFQADPAALRPHLVWFNLTLTLALMATIVARLAPLPVLFMGGLAAALIVNYPKLADQRARLTAHSGNALSVGVMVLAAGAFTGVMAGTGMIDGMAKSILAVLPPAVGPYLAVITAFISIPMNFFLSSDAFYFGVVPVLAETAGHYGISPEEIGRASLLGQPVHSLSPLVAAVYLNCALLGIELGDLQRFAWKYALMLCFVLIGAALLFGVIPLAA
ncbi:MULTISPECIES: CitMHS family transporter [unclassified Sphingopyxis]|uniref:CitMHS family transporter n=1 Tax=unclassified Sphingopyxis TaxID=2614943 RepID=UPI0009E8B137|nr:MULTISPECIES: citrate:proton symporter [unclassified Sphingopyxis]